MKDPKDHASRTHAKRKTRNPRNRKSLVLLFLAVLTVLTILVKIETIKTFLSSRGHKRNHWRRVWRRGWEDHLRCLHHPQELRGRKRYLCLQNEGSARHFWGAFQGAENGTLKLATRSVRNYYSLVKYVLSFTILFLCEIGKNWTFTSAQLMDNLLWVVTQVKFNGRGVSIKKG